MYLKLGRLYLGLEKKTQGVRALKKVCSQLLFEFMNLNYLVSHNRSSTFVFVLYCFVPCLQALAIMEVAHGEDHHYVAEVKREMEEQK